MSRAQLAALAVLAVSTVVGGVSYSVWSPVVGVATLTDAGIAPTHASACDVRFAPDCLAQARDAGLDAHRYERVAFPVYVQADGGAADIVLPPGIPVTSYTGQRCVQVLDWGSCTLTPCADAGAICALWGHPLPVTMTGQVRGCVRAHLDAGLPCLRHDGDGGARDFGDGNVSARSTAVDPATCEPVQCVVYAGDDPMGDL
jgi:hypothetical protein